MIQHGRMRIVIQKVGRKSTSGVEIKFWMALERGGKPRNCLARMEKEGQKS